MSHNILLWKKIFFHQVEHIKIGGLFFSGLNVFLSPKLKHKIKICLSQTLIHFGLQTFKTNWI